MRSMDACPALAIPDELVVPAHRGPAYATKDACDFTLQVPQALAQRKQLVSLWFERSKSLSDDSRGLRHVVRLRCPLSQLLGVDRAWRCGVIALCVWSKELLFHILWFHMARYSRCGAHVWRRRSRAKRKTHDLPAVDVSQA